MKAYDYAKQVVDLLRDAGFSCVIAGGSARDTALGREPKDYDILVMGDTDCSEGIYELLMVHEFDVVTYGIDEDNYTAAGEDTPPHLLWVIKTANVIDLDIIQQRRLPTTPEQVVEGFDVSLNMAWFDDAGDVVKHTEFPEPGGVITVLRDCDVPPARVAYLSQKFPGYIWPTFNSITPY